MKVLVLEDDPTIRTPLAANLREAGYDILEADRASQAEALALEQGFDAFLFDVGLSEGTDAGFRLIERLRQNGVNTPALFLTARDAPEDRARGFRVGGDDYLLKPFLLSEVQARLKALVNRAPDAGHGVLESGELRLDFHNRSVQVAGTPVRLSAKEYAILELLASNPGRIFSHQELLERVWDNPQVVPATVDVGVENVRRKVARWALETVDKLGFRFPLIEPNPFE